MLQTDASSTDNIALVLACIESGLLGPINSSDINRPRQDFRAADGAGRLICQKQFPIS